MIRISLLWIVVPMQFAATAFFVWDIGAGILGFRSEPISWRFREAIEIGAAAGLVAGFVLGLRMLISVTARNREMERKLAAAASAFADLLEGRFRDWQLTPAERDIAWFTLKGFSIAEIAELRQTSDGTVKAQSAAIYRKAGVSNRTQLLSLFIEELLDGRGADRSVS